MLEVKIEGIFESDTGSGQKNYYPFEYVYKTARIKEKGLFTHALKRHAPYLIIKDKKNINRLFSRIKTMTIVDIKKLDENNTLEGKLIKELNDWEIQDLAALYDLYDIPLNQDYSLAELREKATYSYLENVLKIPMKTNKQKEELGFFELQQNGTYKLNYEDLDLKIEIYDYLIEKKQGEKPKKDLNYFINKAKGALVNMGENNQNNSDDEENSSQNKGGLPSFKELLNL